MKIRREKFTRKIKGFLLVCFIFVSFSFKTEAQTNWHFYFGKSAQTTNSILIDQPLKYNGELGYGFDIENTDAAKILRPENSETGYCTANVPFYFSAKVSEGTYEVNITFGATDQNSETTVKAEGRRLMLFQVEVPKGETQTESITVNVRTPKIDEKRSINRKEREMNYMNWDDRLSLEFSGNYPAIQSIEIKPKEKYTTIFLAGNSTVTDQDCAPWASWGQMITHFFDNDISIANYAESGATMSSFKARGRLDKLLTLMQPGDYLFIEFGHNDQKQHGEGIGPWTSFTDLLNEFVNRAREKGGIPVFVTPTQRRSFNAKGIIELTHGDYPAAMRKAAKDLNVPLIDLNAKTKIMYEAWGPEASKKAFVQYPANTFPGQDEELKDNTHFNTFGANEIAQCILQGIIDNKLPIADHIIRFEAPYDPSSPSKFSDWKLIMSPRFVSKKPEGN